jgi:hypothetical protein
VAGRLPWTATPRPPETFWALTDRVGNLDDAQEAECKTLLKGTVYYEDGEDHTESTTLADQRYEDLNCENLGH